MSVKPADPIHDRQKPTQIFIRRFFLIYAFAAAIAIDVVGVALKLYRVPGYPNDFSVFWAAAKSPIEKIYDWGWFGKSQVDLLGDVGPFVYPPTALAWFKPLGLVSPLVALLIWIGLGLTIYLFAARQIASTRYTLLACLSPAVVVALASGQTSLIVGGMTVLALATKSQMYKGVLFGLAVMLKPHAVVLAPLALLAARDYRAMIWTAGVAGAGFLLSLAIWGIQPWTDWIHALSGFGAIVRSDGILTRGVTIAALATNLNAPSWLYLFGSAWGAVLVWRAFRHDHPPLHRLAVFACGCILSIPYAMNYDLAALQIAAVPMLFDRDRSILTGAGAVMVFSTLFVPIGVIVLSVALAFKHDEKKR